MGNGVEQLELDEPLVSEVNPFGGADARWVASPVQTALAELIRQIDSRRRLIVVAGKAGTGKTLLVDMVVRVCLDMGLLTCRIDRGDLADVAHRATSDVVVVDEADSITDMTLQAFLSPDGKTATTCVFMCLPTTVHRFCYPHTYVVNLHSLSRSDARTYLLERAKSIGHLHLFAPDALDLVIYRARGSFRLLRSIASLAFFDAAHEGETQIAVRHVAYALESQMMENVDENDIALRSRISPGDRADEADPPQDEPVVDALETLISHVDEGENLHADVSHSDSADEPGTDPLQRAPIGGALESPTSYVDEERINLEPDVLRNKRRCQTETNPYLQLDVETPLERPETEIATHEGIVTHRIEPLSDRRFPVLGIAIAGLLLAVLIYSGNDIVSFVTRTFEQATEDDLAQKLVNALVPPPIEQQTQVEAPEYAILLPFEVEAPESTTIPLPFEVATTPAVSLRPELLPPIPVIAVTPAISLRPELLPPIPQIAVTRPASLRADLAPAAIRQALIAAAVPVPTRITVTPPVSLRAELLPQRVQAQVPSGRRYGLKNLDSRITLRVHRPTIVAIRDARNEVFIDRKLAPGDTYRVPNLVGLWLTAIDASAVEIILDGASVGFVGAQRATVRDLSLNPQSIADRGMALQRAEQSLDPDSRN